MRALFPLGDVDLLDAYHLCGGRVVNFCTPGAACSSTASQAASARRKGGGGQYPYRGPGYRCVKRGLSVDGIYASSSRDKDDDAVPDDGDTPRAAGWGKGEREGQVVIFYDTLVTAFSLGAFTLGKSWKWFIKKRLSLGLKKIKLSRTTKAGRPAPCVCDKRRRWWRDDLILNVTVLSSTSPVLSVSCAIARLESGNLKHVTHALDVHVSWCRCLTKLRSTQQVVIGEMLPRLVRTFGKALKRRLPTLHNHLCEQVRACAQPVDDVYVHSALWCEICRAPAQESASAALVCRNPPRQVLAELISRFVAAMITWSTTESHL